MTGKKVTDKYLSDKYTEGLTKVYLTGTITDVSTAGQIYIATPFGGTLTGITTVLNGVITTGDAALTAKIGGTAVTGGAITIANSGSAAGIVDTATPTAARTVVAGSSVEIETDGGSTNAVSVFVTLEITI